MVTSPPICQTSFPLAPWMDAMLARLPGLQPAQVRDCFTRDDAYAGQMRRRDALVSSRLQDVHIVPPEAADAAVETLDLVLAHVQHDAGYRIGADSVLRPDGVEVTLDRSRPLLTAGRLVQEDLLLLFPGQHAHVLVGGFLAFPASWTLREKVGRPLDAVHGPVPRYDSAMSARVERVLRHLRPGEPVWRANYLRYNDPELFQPRLESERRPFDPSLPVWVRVERQTLIKLPATGAVVFTIHTYIAPWRSLTAQQAAGLEEAAPTAA